MNIIEATKKALAENKCIAKKCDISEIKHCLKPTNSMGGYIVVEISTGKHISKFGWQPDANDILSEKWMLVDEIFKTDNEKESDYISETCPILLSKKIKTSIEDTIIDTYTKLKNRYPSYSELKIAIVKLSKEIFWENATLGKYIETALFDLYEKEIGNIHIKK